MLLVRGWALSRARAGGKKKGDACSRIATVSKCGHQKLLVPPGPMLRTHERVAVAMSGGGCVYRSSAATQQSTEVKPAESASHVEQLGKPRLSSEHGLDSAVEQLRRRRRTAAIIMRRAP